jgi:hypothetical protein
MGFKKGWPRIIRFEVTVRSSHGHILTRLLAGRGRNDQSSASMPHMDRHYVRPYISVTET